MIDPKNFDLIFISFDEENAEENWNQLSRTHFFNAVQRVHGVQGIHNAHRKASELSSTPYFFTFDGDNQFMPDLTLQMPNYLKEQEVYVWRAQNPINGLVYGYGGLKLWSKLLFENSHAPTGYLDHATEFAPDYKVIHQLATKTLFNTSPYSSWKSGYREASKLIRNWKEKGEALAEVRLREWLSVGIHHPLGDWCLLGAQEAVRDFRTKKGLEINNFKNLRNLFHKDYSPKENLQIRLKDLSKENCDLIPHRLLSNEESETKAKINTEHYLKKAHLKF